MLKGIYTLLITLNTSTIVRIGKLGTVSFREGHYAYVGSALNGLAARIPRHLREEKKLRWHIDYLLQKATISEVIYGITAKNKECAVASQLMMELVPIHRFGCSDCRCKSHLFFCRSRNKLKKTVKNSFKDRGLVPELWK